MGRQMRETMGVKISFQKELAKSHVLELQKLFHALECYVWHGISSKPELDRLLIKHGFDLNEAIGIMDILSGYCERYDLEMRYNKKGYLQIKHTKQS